MKDGIQTFYAEVGEAACYALCIIKLAERIRKREFDINTTLQNGIDAGHIYYNPTDQNDSNNFYVKRADDYLSLLTGEDWDLTHEDYDYEAKHGELEIDRWDRKRVGYGTMSHFRLPDWDSLVNSQTVKYGAIATKRIFRRKTSTSQSVV